MTLGALPLYTVLTMPTCLARVVVVVSCVTACGAAAAERDFAFSWTTRTLQAERNEIETWLTPRVARTEASDALLDVRLAWAHGVTAAVESQLSLDLGFQSFGEQSTVDPRVTGQWRFAPLRADGVLGVGVVGRLSLGFDIAELGAALVLDKQLGDLLLVANLGASQAALWSGRTGVTTRPEASLGLAYAVASYARIGLEGRFKAAFAGGDFEGAALYLGPSLAFRFSKAWVSLAVTVQSAAVRNKADAALAEPMTLRDDERFVLRLGAGFLAD